MDVVAITGQRQSAIVERPMPRPRDGIAVVRIDVAPMCTEYKAFATGQGGGQLGHEAAGEVVATDGPGRVRPGERVIVMPSSSCGRCALCLNGDYIHCQQPIDVLAATGSPSGRATYAQYVLKPEWLLIPIPDDLSTTHAAMACCGLGPTFGAMQRLAVDAMDTVLITGMGPVGLGGVVNGVARGARVLAVESHPYRADLARRLGAEAVFDPADPSTLPRILELTGGRGVDKALDCSGAPAAQRLLIDASRRRGHVALVGEGGDFTLHVSRDLLRKGLTLHGVWHWNLRDTHRLLDVIRRSRPLIDHLVTHTFPLRRVQDAWELQISGNCGKVILAPWE
jgi:L-iditol 2-dehydrogenase